MQTRTKLLDDLSKVLTNAVGVAQGAKTEADNAVRGLLDKWLSDREFVTREEFDVFKAIAIKTREENEFLIAFLYEKGKSVIANLKIKESFNIWTAHSPPNLDHA